jgi:hypothetical protein
MSKLQRSVQRRRIGCGAKQTPAPHASNASVSPNLARVGSTTSADMTVSAVRCGCSTLQRSLGPAALASLSKGLQRPQRAMQYSAIYSL